MFSIRQFCSTMSFFSLGTAPAAAPAAAAAGVAQPQQQPAQEVVQPEWNEECDRFSFDDSDRFEEDSLCSWSSEPESLCNNWRGWKRPIANGNFGNGTTKRQIDGKQTFDGADILSPKSIYIVLIVLFVLNFHKYICMIYCDGSNCRFIQ